MRQPLRLDPTWWHRIATGYEQQDGYGRLVRLRAGARTVWALYIDDKYRGSCPTFAEAKQRALEISSDELEN